MSPSVPQSQRGNRIEYDVLVLGAGVAGLSYVLALLQKNPETKIALVCKQSLSASNSFYAQGGMASVKLHSDSFEKHIADTLAAGDGLCHDRVVREIITSAPAAIDFLEKHGVQFDRDASTYDLTREGGHSERRIYHTGDHTGAEIIKALLCAVKASSNVTVFENHTAVNLITQIPQYTPGASQEVVGAYILEENTQLIHTFLAKVTVLATGGAGKVYRYTTNPDVATGDGLAMAYRAGARVGNLEFIQFHPTLLYHPGMNNFLITEALRGEGAYLRLPENDKRFMEYYAPDKMELATRDIVARAIFSEIEKSSYRYVNLDVRHLDKTYLTQRFPAIYQALLSLGIDMSQDYIPVVPAAHYLCGGVLADVQGQTDLKRLYAIGEVAFTGFHGANRLASNSLLEAVVMAQNAADETTKHLNQPLHFYKEIFNWSSKGVVNRRRASQINAHWRGLRGEMTSYAGIVRTAEGLQDLLKLIRTRREMIEHYYWQHVVTRDVVELRNIVLSAELIVHAALMREESRGGHYREDYAHKFHVPQETVLRSERTSCLLADACEEVIV